ncbi:MAG: hypothetical protein Q3983_03770 [Capnocytophaga sp.]|nr:hypothetical protein [Capnocytophaga sp.]
MKHFFLLSFLSFLLFSCKNSNEKTDLEKQNLHGDISSIRMIPYKPIENNGKIQKGEVAQERENSLVIYNPDGNQKEKIFYQKNNDLARKYTYTYNDKKQRTRVDYHKVEGNLNLYYQYKYDDKGNRTEINEYTDKGLLYTQEKRKFDDNNNLKEQSVYNDKGLLLKRVIFSYNKDNNCISEQRFDENNTLVAKYNYNYDKNDNIIEEKFYNLSGLVHTRTYVYTFDDEKNWISRIEYQNNKPNYIIERKITYGKEEKQSKEDKNTAQSTNEEENYDLAVRASALIKDDWQALHLKGNVKTLRRIAYYPDGKRIKEDGLNILYVFHKNGLFEKVKEFNHTNKETNETIYSYSYNEKGKLSQREAKNSKLNTVITNYDEGNRIIEEINDIEISDFQNDYEYDTQGRIIFKSFFDTEVYYKYNKNNEIIEEITKTEDKEYKTLFEYDDKGNFIKQTIYINGNLSNIIDYKYTYDKENNWLTRIEIQKNITTEVIKSEITYF